MTKAELEKARSLETEKVLGALTGMRIMTPAGLRTYRSQDHQFVYAVPVGQVVSDPKYPIPVLGNLRMFPVESYYRWPPFAPVASTK